LNRNRSTTILNTIILSLTSMNYIDSAVEATDVAEGGINPSLHLRIMEHSKGHSFFKSSTSRSAAIYFKPQSLFPRPARVYYTPVSAFALQRPLDTPAQEQQAL
jgi:hypothetical protein